MVDKGDNISDKEITEEDLLDFELEDLSPEELAADSGSGRSEEDILELVDLVEEGKRDELKDSFGGEIAELMKEEEELQPEGLEPPPPQVADAQEGLDAEESLGELEAELDLSDLSLTDLAEEAGVEPEEEIEGEERGGVGIGEKMAEQPTAAMEMDFSLEEEVEPDVAEEEIGIPESELEKMLVAEPSEEPILDLESPIEVSEPAVDSPKEVEFIEPAPEEGEEIFLEGMAEAPSVEPEPTRPETASIEPVGEAPIGISEEKIEAIVTRVVEDVVERVARETMANVAEKVIREAIDALRESLESESD